VDPDKAQGYDFRRHKMQTALQLVDTDFVEWFPPTTSAQGEDLKQMWSECALQPRYSHKGGHRAHHWDLVLLSSDANEIREVSTSTGTEHDG